MSTEKINLTADDIKEWVKSYETTQKLPSTRIPCYKCKCGVTATHTNLKDKIKKYGSLTNLLNKFVCKNCNINVNAQKPKADKAIKKKTKAKKVEENTHLQKDSSGRYDIPLIDFNRTNKVYSIEDIAANASLTKEFTTGTCLKPRLYLDNDSYCNGCLLYENCACSSKRLNLKQRK